MTNFDNLVAKISSFLNNNGLDDLGEQEINDLLGLMNSYYSRREEWKKYEYFDVLRYTRNLVDDGNGEYNLLLLCWGPGHASPIHDHAGSHCCMKVLEGELEEHLYFPPVPSQPLALKSVTKLKVNESRYISDKIGLHRIANNTDLPAVSLHLYSPPINSCTTFTVEGDKRKCGNVCLYSKYGVPLNKPRN